MIVAEVLCQHLLYGGSVIVSVDYDKLEGCSDNIDDIVDDEYAQAFVKLIVWLRSTSCRVRQQ